MKKYQEILLDIGMIFISIAIGIFLPVFVSSDFKWNSSDEILFSTEPVRVPISIISQGEEGLNQEVELWDDINTVSKSSGRKILMKDLKSNNDFPLMMRELFAVLEDSLSIKGKDFCFDSTAALIVANDDSCMVEWTTNGMMFYDSGSISVTMRINEKGTITAFEIFADPGIEKMRINSEDIGGPIKTEKDTSLKLVENIGSYIAAKNHSEIIYCSIEAEENGVTFCLFFSGETNCVQELKFSEGKIISLMPV